mmetsp:Transcript_16760/g.39801  ORF Transcript_16760/g.39801 Transcript_16760/m.39801 type:complete len:102 (+) Transcript_16760:114-419(+)
MLQQHVLPDPYQVKSHGTVKKLCMTTIALFAFANTEVGKECQPTETSAGLARKHLAKVKLRPKDPLIKTAFQSPNMRWIQPEHVNQERGAHATIPTGSSVR